MLYFKNKIAILSLLLTTVSCNNITDSKFEQVQLEASQIQAINKAIDRYNDDKISRILEIRDYNRALKLFCIHQTVQIRKEPEPSRQFDVTAKLYCAEADIKGEIGGKNSPYSNLVNLSLLPVRYRLVRSDNDKFIVSTSDLPRQAPDYVKDIQTFFTREEINAINLAKISSEEIGDRLREKIAKDYKSQSKLK